MSQNDMPQLLDFRGKTVLVAIHLTATLGKAWAPLGIRVNGVAPGLVALDGGRMS